MKGSLVFCTALVLAALVVLSGCSSAAPAPQPTTKPAAQPTAGPAAQPAAQPTVAPAAKFPTKGIEMVVGFDPGSGSDNWVRAFAPSLQKALGQNVTVLNQAGAGGILGWTNSSKAKADGYTVGHVSMPSMSMAAVLNKVEYDPLNSFTWLGEIGLDPVAISVKKGGPFKTLKDLLDASAKDPGKITVGATGKGSIDYSVGVSLQRSANAKITIVNFDGLPSGVTAVLGDNLSAMAMSASSALRYEKSDQLLTLAVAGDTRSPSLPNVPTFKEQGVTPLVNGIYVGFIGPKGLPADVTSVLVKAIKTAFDDPEFKALADKNAFPLMYISPESMTGLAKQMNDAAKDYLAQ